ncbi:TrmH family RNA methyltransferase [Candidatus Gottesmanbacteria bacterium]|nr:TrmH family RNA methyltransferase [Candidatus Gottesmanbacteria bacterium]
MLKLNAQELRTTDPTPEQIKAIKKRSIYIILDNVLDTYNVGSIFRLADAVAAQKIYICGESLTPPHTRIKKASVSTWKWVEWEYALTAIEAIIKLKNQHSEIKIIVVEQSEKSERFDQAKYELPLALVVGNETHGVSKEVLDIADLIVELPMFGVNKSLNVMVSCGIVLYEITKQIA